MKQKIIVNIFLFVATAINAQISVDEQVYNSFSSRNYIKFNQFLTVPTLSVLRNESTSISVLGRKTNMGFEGSPQLYLASYGGKILENMGAGVAIYKQDVNIFNDFGTVINYAYQIQMDRESHLALGLNFTYSSRGLAANNVQSSFDDPALQNYQRTSVINLQPAVTYSMNNFDIGLFFENVVDYNMTQSKMISSFAEKTISLHAMYNYELWLRGYLFEEASIKMMSVIRKQPEGVGLGVNAVLDLPKLGWLKLTYDKDFGFLAGIGVNLYQGVSLALGYEMGSLASTAEVGIVYNLGERDDRPRRRKTRTSKPRRKTKAQPKKKPTKKPTEEKETIEQKKRQEIIEEERRKIIIRDTVRVVDTVKVFVKDTIKTTVKDTIRTTVKDTIRTTIELDSDKDTSLKRRTETPWREKTITREGGGGTMHYVAIDQFRSIGRVRALLRKYEKGKVKLRYIKDPKTQIFYVYLDRFAKKEDADELVKEVNGGRRGFEDNKANDLGIKMKSVSKDPVYRVKVTIGGKSQTFKEPKTQPRARVRVMNKVPGLEEGYYLQVMVFSKKAYADKFLDELRADNIKVDYFINPANGYRHIYLVKTKDRAEIIRLYNNNLNGTYYDSKNIIHIK